MIRLSEPQANASRQAEGWSRVRLLGILVAAGLTAVVLVGALAYGTYQAFTGVPASTRHERLSDHTRLRESALPATGMARRDAIASAPMLHVPRQAAMPSPATSTAAPTIDIPGPPGVPGPGLVMSGYPRTPEGAIGQLAQIDVAILQAMNVTTARDVHAAWALPGGVDDAAWWMTASVQAFLDGAGMGGVKAPTTWVTAEPAAALIKGTDGPDWVTVCVLLKVTATYRNAGQAALAHCERMQWVGGRWMLAPGTPPALPPSTWPGTKLALEAGWATWRTTDPGSPGHGVEAPPDPSPPPASYRVDPSPARLARNEHGAVATALAVTRAQIGFNATQAVAVAATYAAPAQRAAFEDRARAAVATRRRLAGVDTVGEPRSPASYAATPLAYTVHRLGPGRCAVHLLSWITLTTTEALARDHLAVGTTLLRWSDGWRLTSPSAGLRGVLAAQQPPAALPGTRAFARGRWTPLDEGVE